MFKLIRLGGIATLALFVVLYVLAGVTKIVPGEVGLVVKQIGSDRGILEQTLDTGYRWVEPFTNDVVTYDTRIKQFKPKEAIPSTTKDGQPILIELSLEIGLVDAGVPNLHERVGGRYFEQLVYPAMRAAIRNSTSAKLSDEIYTAEGRIYVQDQVQTYLQDKVGAYGISVAVNLRDLQFQNEDFNRQLEKKAQEAQQIEIKRREALSAENEAIRVANIAEGQKQQTIKQAEAERERLRLQGEGERLQKEEIAKGILAVGQAEAEAMRLKSLALGAKGGEHLVGLAWAESISPNIKFWGVPTGAPGTQNIMDLNGVLNKLGTGQTAQAEW